MEDSPPPLKRGTQKISIQTGSALIRNQQPNSFGQFMCTHYYAIYIIAWNLISLKILRDISVHSVPLCPVNCKRREQESNKTHWSICELHVISRLGTSRKCIRYMPVRCD
jgi:hypothetical protein